MKGKKPKVNEIKMKAKKTRNELKVSDSNTYPLKNEERMKNGEERRKTFTDLLTETSRKRYESTSTCIFFTETIFHPKQLKCKAKGVRDLWNSPLSPIYRKKGEEVAAQLAQASWVASFRSNPASKIFWKGVDSKI